MSDVTIDEVDDLDCHVITHDWAFERERATEIEANWQRQLMSGRKIWNGRVLLAHDPRIVTRDGRRLLTAGHFQTSFANFLAFRDFGFPDPRVKNCFAMAALRAADGPFLLARMAAHTANAGMVYFAAGTPDPGDIHGDRLDLAGSVMRELKEETGLTAADGTSVPGYTITWEGGRVACLKEIRTLAPARDVIAKVEAFLATEQEPEIEAIVPVRSEADLLTGAMPGFIVAYLRARLAADRGQFPTG